jgi:N-acetylneuraminic acid mutarotase
MRITTSYHLMLNLKTRFAATAMLIFSALFFSACREDDVEPEYLGNWYQKALPDFDGITRRNAAAFSIGNSGYVGLGFSGNQERLADFWEYNSQEGFWTQRAAFEGGARQDVVAFSINQKGYIGTGYDGEYKSDLWEYDPSTNSWTEVAPLPSSSGAPARQQATAFVLNDKAYIGLGFDGNYKQDFYEFTPDANGGSWKQISTFTGGKRQGASAFVVDGRAFVGFGRGNTGTIHQDLYEFNPAGPQVWIPKAELEDNPRANAIALPLNGKGYIIGGVTSSARSDVWEYDPAADTWTQKTAFEGAPRSYPMGFVANGTIYFGTGQASGGFYLDDFWGFNPDIAVVEGD